MSDRYKYAKNGIYKCENFAEQVEQNRFPAINIGSIGGIPRWYLKCTLRIKNDQVILYPSIFCNPEPKVRIRTFFNILKKDGSSGSMRRNNTWILEFNVYKLLGKPFDVSELLNPENEYLDDEGSLSIEYGIQCDAIWYKCWTFNFKDTVFNYSGEENQMVGCSHRTIFNELSKLYCSAEIINFHCPKFVQQAKKVDSLGMYPSDFFRCLQILHGVRLQINKSDYFDVLKMARFFNLSNVIQYCDQFCFKGRYGFWETKSLSFCRIINFNLKHVLAEKLKNLDWKNVVKIAKELDFGEATGEAMKTFVAKILYN